MSLPYVLGDSGQAITDFQNLFRALYRSYAPAVTGKYDAATVVAVKELQRRLGLPQTGEFEYFTAKFGGFPTPRHLAIVFRGTGGIIGLDYVSRVCQGASDLVEERNPYWPASFGGLPVGAAGGVGDPSMANAVDIGFTNGKQEFLNYYRTNPKIKVVIGGYSAGAVVAAKLREWILANYPDNYLCSFSFGDPTRPSGGSYFAGNTTAGHGISSWLYGDIKDWRHCWLAQPGDMYTSVPDGAVGKVLQDGYDGITKVQLSDPFTTIQHIISMVLAIMADSGISLPGIATAAAAGPTGIVGFFITLLMGALQGLIGGITGAPASQQPSIAAGVQAAIIGLKFIATNPPTLPHITYEFGEVWPGQTYLGLATQHVRDWASRITPT